VASRRACSEQSDDQAAPSRENREAQRWKAPRAQSKAFAFASGCGGRPCKTNRASARGVRRVRSETRPGHRTVAGGSCFPGCSRHELATRGVRIEKVGVNLLRRAVAAAGGERKLISTPPDLGQFGWWTSQGDHHPARGGSPSQAAQGSGRLGGVLVDRLSSRSRQAACGARAPANRR
jgi:hypothetical protein